MQRMSVKAPSIQGVIQHELQKRQEAQEHYENVLQKAVEEFNKQFESNMDDARVGAAPQRKLSVIQGKIRFNGKFLDPRILKKREWELDGTAKYEKGILEHVQNQLQAAKSENPNVKKYWEENKIDLYGADLLDTVEEDAKEEEDGVVTQQKFRPRR